MLPAIAALLPVITALPVATATAMPLDVTVTAAVLLLVHETVPVPAEPFDSVIDPVRGSESRHEQQVGVGSDGQRLRSRRARWFATRAGGND